MWTFKLHDIWSVGTYISLNTSHVWHIDDDILTSATVRRISGRKWAIKDTDFPSGLPWLDLTRILWIKRSFEKRKHEENGYQPTRENKLRDDSPIDSKSAISDHAKREPGLDPNALPYRPVEEKPDQTSSQHLDAMVEIKQRQMKCVQDLATQQHQSDVVALPKPDLQVFGGDPIVWLCSGLRLPNRAQDRQQQLPVVLSNTIYERRGARTDEELPVHEARWRLCWSPKAAQGELWAGVQICNCIGLEGHEGSYWKGRRSKGSAEFIGIADLL